MNTSIQQSIDNGSGIISLPPGEYKGPFYIEHPCTIEGNNTTLWNSRESVLIIRSEGVVLKNLRIELINEESGSFAVCTDKNVKTENVEITGRVSGFGPEDIVPDMTRQIKLGKFRAETENSYIIDMYSAGKAVLSTDMKDIVLEPVKLEPGINSVTVKILPVPSGTLLYGDILLKSDFTRRFYINGNAADSAEISTDNYISRIDPENIIKPDAAYTIAEERSQVLKSIRQNNNINESLKSESCSDILSGPGIHILKRGERIGIKEYENGILKVYMGYRALFKQIDIDPYAFMLDANGVTSCDDDFVFFGNTETNSGALHFNEDKSIDVDLQKVPDHIQKLSFVYSIYKPEPNDNFSKVMDPYISLIRNGAELVRYTASELFAETTIIFIEIYRHSTGWKLNTVGQGYREGLKRLCANYGLIVS